MVLIYGIVGQIIITVTTLCAHLFTRHRSFDFSNRHLLALAFWCPSWCRPLISDNPPYLIRPIAISLRHFSDCMLREADALAQSSTCLRIPPLPISHIHGKILFNRAYAAVLSVR